MVLDSLCQHSLSLLGWLESWSRYSASVILSPVSNLACLLKSSFSLAVDLRWSRPEGGGGNSTRFRSDQNPHWVHGIFASWSKGANCGSSQGAKIEHGLEKYVDEETGSTRDPGKIELSSEARKREIEEEVQRAGEREDE